MLNVSIWHQYNEPFCIRKGEQKSGFRMCSSVCVSLRTMINRIPIVQYPHFRCCRYSHTYSHKDRWPFQRATQRAIRFINNNNKQQTNRKFSSHYLSGGSMGKTKVVLDGFVHTPKKTRSHNECTSIHKHISRYILALLRVLHKASQRSISQSTSRQSKRVKQKTYENLSQY